MKKVVMVALLGLLIPFMNSSGISAHQEFEAVVFDYDTGESSTVVIPCESDSSISPSSDAGAMPYSIIGTDDRTQVNSNVTPYSRVVLIQAGFDLDGDNVVDKNVYSTGAMVASDVVLTCAHSVYWYGDSAPGSAKMIKIYTKYSGAAQNGNVSASATYYYPKTWTLPASYINTKNTNYDWCVIKMREPIGNNTGWFGYAKDVSVNSQIYVSGYPEDHKFYQYCSGGTVNSTSTYRFSYNADTANGQSGAPVFDGNYIIRGVHTSGSTSGNSGCRITTELFNTIESNKQ